MNPLRRKFEAARDRAKELRPIAERTAEQDAELLEVLDRAEQIKAELDAQADTDARLEQLVGDVSRAVQMPGTVITGREAPELSAGEYFAAVGKMLNGEMSADEFADRAARYHDFDRATGVSGDVAGILPEPIVGPIIDTYDDRRRVWSSFRQLPMESTGKTFERPKVTQHVLVGEQAAEGEDLASRKFTLGSDTVTKRTFGGTLEVSRQMQDWCTPSALGLVVADFMKVYARFTEAAAVTHLTGLATATELWDPTSTASIVKSFVDGALAVGDALDDDEPLTIWIDTASAAELTAPTGSTDRSVWSVVQDALGALDSSIDWVVSRRLPADTRIIGAGGLVEAYEQRHGLLSMVKPTNLTTDVSYSGYAAFHGIAAGFVSLEAA